MPVHIHYVYILHIKNVIQAHIWIKHRNWEYKKYDL